MASTIYKQRAAIVSMLAATRYKTTYRMAEWRPMIDNLASNNDHCSAFQTRYGTTAHE